MTDINELCKDSREELRAWYLAERPGRNDLYDQIYEIADSQVPVYTSDLYDCLATCHRLGEISGDMDFKDIESVISYNIMEMLIDDMHQYVPDLEEEVMLLDDELEEDEEDLAEDTDTGFMYPPFSIDGEDTVNDTKDKK